MVPLLCALLGQGLGRCPGFLFPTHKLVLTVGLLAEILRCQLYIHIVDKENKTTQTRCLVWCGSRERKVRFGGAIVQGVCCETGTVDASGCVIFVSSGITFC